MGKMIQISVPVDTSASTGSVKEVGNKDKWNYWVYQIGGNSSFNGNENNRSGSWDASLNANRETEKWKTNISLEASKSYDVYKDSSGETKFKRKN